LILSNLVDIDNKPIVNNQNQILKKIYDNKIIAKIFGKFIV